MLTRMPDERGTLSASEAVTKQQRSLWTSVDFA
jgi:hypothetical protein